MRTQWNDTEDDALIGLPLLARVIYLQAIRRYMDYETGITGQRRAISYQMLREIAFIEPTTGRQSAGVPTLKSVRVALRQLIEAGLIESIGTDKRLIFRCLMADAQDSATNKEGRPRADLGQTYQGTENVNNDSSLQHSCGRPRADLNTAYQGNPQESGIQDKNGAIAPSCRSASKSRFPEFWDAWPAGQRKRDRFKAEKAWQRQRLDDMADMVIADVKRRSVEDDQWLRGYVPMPTTYIRGKRWEDEYTAPKTAGNLDDKRKLDEWLNESRVIEGEFSYVR